MEDEISKIKRECKQINKAYRQGYLDGFAAASALNTHNKTPSMLKMAKWKHFTPPFDEESCLPLVRRTEN